MPAVVVQGADIQCEHNGKVTIAAGQQVLLVDQATVHVLADFGSAQIVCPLQPPATRCTAISPPTEGVSTRLMAGGSAVLLDTAHGNTNAGTWRVRSAGQEKLEAT